MQSKNDIAISGDQIKEARRLLGWSIHAISRSGNIARETIAAAEKAGIDRLSRRSQIKIRALFDRAGIDFSGGRATIRFRTSDGAPAAGGRVADPPADP